MVSNRFGPSVRAHLPALVALTAAFAGCVAPSVFEASEASGIVPADTTALEDRVLSWRVPLAADDFRGLRLLYDTPLSHGPTLAVVRSIVRSNHRLDPFDALVFATAAVRIAREHRLDYGFFCGTLLQESAFDPDARSSAGAVGIGQFTLATASDYGIDPFVWRDAMEGSAALLGRYVHAYDGLYPDPYAAALAAYNAGPGTVAYYKGIPPYPETRGYIDDIEDRWSRIVRDAGEDGAASVKLRAVLHSPPDDPARYLEDASDPATIAWTARENARTRAALDALPDRARLAARFEALTQIDSQGVPVVRGRCAFYTARRGEGDQPVLYVRGEGGERSLLDPAELDATGLTSLDWWYPSPGGTYIAFGLSHGGDERSRLGVVEVATGRRLGEAIPDTRHCSLAWLPQESGFYYTRYPAGGDYDVRVYRHELGADPAADALVFGEGRKPEEWTAVALSPDGRHLCATVYDGWARSDAYVANAGAEPLRFEPLAQGGDNVFETLLGNDKLYVRTNDGAPRFRIYEVDYAHLERDRWREIVPQERGSLDGFALARGALLLHYLIDARSVLKYGTTTAVSEPVPALAGATVLDVSAQESSPEAYVLAASFLEAPAVTRLRFEAGRTTAERWSSVAVPFEASAYRSEQVWYSSNDGTRIPLTVIARRDVARDGSAPAVLYGYGGFNVSLIPGFMPSIVPWLEAGGVYAIANLRGGGEFGDDWHRAGMRERKQNVFDDFAAAVRYLGSSGIADPKRIAVFGGSNGGLLVATLATQHPEIVRAVVCLVPLTDMLRFHLFSIARLWISEYGDPDDAADALFLRAYSPYHNVVDGVAYPAMLVATAESDGRVDPMHARKFGARVLAANGGSAPILIYVEPDAGHGAGKPRHKRVAELADHWAFIGWQLGKMLA